eukprot:XP_027303724.1 uncharacterized protein LOC113841241 [Anas platyrhynchos]
MVRENAMKLFSACMERVLWKHRRKMWKKVHNVLLTLYLRMSEENPSVGAHGVGGLAAGEAGGEEPVPIPCLAAPQAAQEALRAWSELLWWDELQVVAHMNQTLGSEHACLILRLTAEHHRDQSEEKVYEIIAILEPMMNDAEPSVCEETACTIQTVRQHLHWLRRLWEPRYVLVVHCCLPRRLWQVPKQKPEPESQKNPQETSESEDSSLVISVPEHGQEAGLQLTGVLDASRIPPPPPPTTKELKKSHLFIQSLLGSLLSVLHSPRHPPSSAPASLEQLPSSRSSGPRPGRHIPLTAPQGQSRGGRGPLPTS